jgi:hypothetical protein
VKTQKTTKIYSIQDFKNLKRITLKEAEIRKLNLLGSAKGANFGLCLYSGILHCKNFVKKAKYCVIVDAIKIEDAEDKINQGKMMTVRFYGDC